MPRFSKGLQGPGDQLSSPARISGSSSTTETSAPHGVEEAGEFKAYRALHDNDRLRQFRRVEDAVGIGQQEL